MGIFKTKEKNIIEKKSQSSHTVCSIISIPVDKIIPNLYQPRAIFDNDSIMDLADSIKEFGIIQPLIIREHGGRYELVAGERRLRAAKLANLREVPCIITEYDTRNSAFISIIENLQRTDLDFFEEAHAISRLVREFDLTQREIAEKLSKSQSAIANKLRLVRFSQETAKKIRQAGLTERHARALLKIEDKTALSKAIDFIANHKLNVEATEKYVESLLNPKRGGTTKFVFKDIRLFLNSINHTVTTMKNSGVPVDFNKNEVGDYICMEIKIRKC